MKIASIVTKGQEKGDSIIIASRDESQTILEVFFEYCEQNKRKTKAKKMLKEFEDNLQCY